MAATGKGTAQPARVQTAQSVASSRAPSSKGAFRSATLAASGRKATAGQCPPWSTPLKPAVRLQSTTLQFSLHQMPQELAAVQARLSRDRYQPTSADHGLAFIARGVAQPEGKDGEAAAIVAATPAPSRPPTGASVRMIPLLSEEASALPPRASTAASQLSTTSGKRRIRHVPLQHPSWWGQAGGAEPSRPSYEEHGSWFPRQTTTIAGQESLEKESLPLLNAHYDHQNPFTAMWMKRGPGGAIVCDISVSGKP
mmetsp:Transcript_65743/g.142668  ORF Transcript_65743/g.142668 Transcript_65743/m.142668 type:complete len:254 (-) Transcript_65743:6-767(-)